MYCFNRVRLAQKNHGMHSLNQSAARFQKNSTHSLAFSRASKSSYGLVVIISFALIGRVNLLWLQFHETPSKKVQELKLDTPTSFFNSFFKMS